jgi:TonB family protein
MHRLVCTIVLIIAGCGHTDNKLHVKYIEQPDYPLSSRLKNEQGTVLVNVDIDASGRVTRAKGSGAPETLVKAAEGNVQHWVFGPFPDVSVFPIDHTIQYVYRLEGKPLAVVITPPVVKTFLPDRIEISAVPFVSDTSRPLVDRKPSTITRSPP